VYSVIIVDDEEPVLESCEFMLNSFSEGEEMNNPFILAGKARTGYDALKMIEEINPDLVFMDINIPGLDGLAVLERVHKQFPRMICILSTAYERFDLARRAIPLGVFAYLVKPVSKTTFYSTLENVLIQLRSLQAEQQMYNMAGRYSDPVHSLLQKDIQTVMDEQRWNWYRKKLQLPSDLGQVLLVEMEKDLELWGNRIAEELSYKYHCICDIVFNRIIILISGGEPSFTFVRSAGGSGDHNTRDFRQKAEKLLNKLLIGIVWNFGLGRLYHGPQLYLSYGEALAELMEKRQKDDTWSKLGKEIAVLRRKIGLLPPEKIKAMFKTIWEPLFLEDFHKAKLRMVSFFTLLLDDLYGAWQDTRQRKNNNKAPVLPFDPAEIMELSDLESWKRWSEPCFEMILYQAGVERQSNYPQPLVHAMAFIQENYTQNIQLKDAADAALVSNAHLSRLFAEHLKSSFSDYLSALRINEAERLLKTKSITVKEAAFRAGYHDPNYFSKIFKKIKGILPTEVQ